MFTITFVHYGRPLNGVHTHSPPGGTAPLPVPCAGGDGTWQPVGVGDFDGNGKGGILWRHKGTGANKIWPMDGFTREANASIPAFSNTDWTVEGTGDFDKDDQDDILWRNQVTGANKIWMMAGT